MYSTLHIKGALGTVEVVTSNNPARSKFSTLHRVCKHIPGHLVAKLARKHCVDEQARTFTTWSRLVSLLYAQLAHATGLNNACDSLRIHSGPLGAVRGAKAPMRNTFSHSNRTRSAEMAGELFWEVLAHLQTVRPCFGAKTYKGEIRGRYPYSGEIRNFRQNGKDI